MKIHVSENTKLLLDQIGGFRLEKRGTIEIKVKLLLFLYVILECLSILTTGFREKELWKRSGCWAM